MSLAINMTVSGDTLYFYVNIHDGTGASSDADSAPTWRIYRHENGTAVANGTMALLDDTNTTGFYSEAVDLAAYDPGVYVVRVSATVDSIAAAASGVFQHGGGQCLLRTTIAAVTDNGQFTLTAGPSANDALNLARVIIRDAADAGLFSWESVDDYIGATKEVFLSDTPTHFTFAAGDYVEFYPPESTVLNGVSDALQITAQQLDTLDDSVATLVASTSTIDGTVDAIRVVTDAIATRVASGVVDTGASTTSLPTSSLTPTPGVADQFLHRIVTFRNNTITANLRGVSTVITDLTSTTLTVSPALPATPAAGDTFDIL